MKNLMIQPKHNRLKHQQTSNMPASGTATCFHCSDSLPQPNPHAYSCAIAGETRWFCCPACQMVAETIHNLGLSAYYNQREQKPAHAINIDQDMSEMDLPDIQATFLHRQNDGSVKADLLVPDIHCASCCWLIEHRLKSLSGVLSVSAQLGQQKVSVHWSPETIQPSQIFSALAGIGYRAIPWHDTDRELQSKARQSELLKRAGVAGIVAMQIHMIAMGNYFGAGDDLELPYQQLMNGSALLLSLPVWFYSAKPFFSSAWNQLRQGFLGMDLPVALAIVTAALSSIYSLANSTNDVYFDSISMFVFLLLIARYLEARARNRLSIHAQIPPLPKSCYRLIDGKKERVSTHSLKAGDIVTAKAGDIIAVDGTVIEGSAAIEQSLITGEFQPTQCKIGQTVLAGSIMRSGEIVIQARQWGGESQIAQLQQRVESAMDCKMHSTPYDAIARFFTPLVLLVAAGTGCFWLYHDPAKAMIAVMAVLVASCPCALSLAIPTVQAAALTTLRSQGILITQQDTLLKLPHIRCMAFDKTGSLTEGKFCIQKISLFQNIPEQTCLEIASALESHSTHPIATAFLAQNFTIPTQTTSQTPLSISGIIEHPHLGIEGTINGKHYRIGSPKWLNLPDENTANTEVILANDQLPIARFQLGDTIRHDADDCIQSLKKRQIHCAILSGDSSENVAAVAKSLHISEFYKTCTPDYKVQLLDKLRQQYGCTAMLGDGINDGPVLSKADISLVLADASQTAKIAADVILLNNNLNDINVLLNTGKRAAQISRQNVAWAFVYNIVILPVAAAGLLPPAAAALGMATSSLLVTLNAFRLFKIQRTGTFMSREP